MIHRLVSTLSELGGDPGTALCLQALPIRTHPLLHPVTVADILEEAIEVVAAAGEITTVGVEEEEEDSTMIGTVSASAAAPTTAVGGAVNEMTATEETDIPWNRTACYTENRAASASCCRNELETSPCSRGLNKLLASLQYRRRRTCPRRPLHHRHPPLDPCRADSLRMQTFNH